MRLQLCVLLTSTALLAAVAAPGRTLVAQDVEALGERYGTLPPPAYFEALASDPGAFQFTRGRTARLRARMAAEAARERGVPRVLGPREGPALGTFRIPVILGLFSDSPDSLRYGLDTIQAAYFSDAPGTITDFYDELSGGRARLEGDVMDWTRASFTRAEATGGESGLTRGTTGPFITQLLARLNNVDWGLYDNDGPDGLPNSGDDDGYVDALAVIQPTAGAECGGIDQDNRIWSHRWSLTSAAGSGFVTAVPAAGGQFIRIDDYVIQPVFDCNEGDLSPIGVFAHELGHAFGLPDLYDTNSSGGKHAGVGTWDLMSSGSFGCDNDSGESPCHMGAWSKSMLGWAHVVTVPPDTDLGILTLPPVETGGPVYRIDAIDGSGEYFLLENRQRLGFDRHLFGEGLLIWHIDPDWVSQRWASNRVNAEQHRGVWLRQADGKDDLGVPGGGRGDRGDPFPYFEDETGKDTFHATSRPRAESFLGTPTGLTLLDIESVGDDVRMRLLSRFSRVTVRAEGGDGSGGIFTVDGASVEAESHTFESAPFVQHTVLAASGQAIAEGVRRPFLGWLDDAGAGASRDVVVPLEDLQLVARYEGRQLALSIEVTGAVNGVAPGAFVTQPPSPDLWFDVGTQVTVEAVPTTGFDFAAWFGGLAGQPNPASVTLADPISAGAIFTLTYAIVDATVDVPAATPVDIRFEVENGIEPISWLRTGGQLPDGLTFETSGRVSGAALELGSFGLEVVARDVRGLLAEATIVLEIGDPGISLDRLASPFLSVGEPLTQEQQDFLDNVGNRSGGYDLGDFRAWVLANPDLPFTANAAELARIGPRTVVLEPRRDGAEGGR